MMFDWGGDSSYIELFSGFQMASIICSVIKGSQEAVRWPHPMTVLRCRQKCCKPSNIIFKFLSSMPDLVWANFFILTRAHFHCMLFRQNNNKSEKELLHAKKLFLWYLNAAKSSIKKLTPSKNDYILLRFYIVAKTSNRYLQFLYKKSMKIQVVGLPRRLTLIDTWVS